MTAYLPLSATEDLSVVEDELNALVPLPSLKRVLLSALLIMVVAFGGLVTWAMVTPLERAIVASGSLISEGRRKAINLPDAGILREMLVRDGERVVAGQVLFRLDTTQTQATADQAAAQYWGGIARISRLRAEQADLRQFSLPDGVEAAALQTPSLRELADTESHLFAARWEAFDGAVAVQERQIAVLTAQLQAAPLQRRAAERQLAAVQERLRGFNELARTGVGSRFRVLELQENEASYQSSIAQYTSLEAQTLQAIAQARALLATLRLNRQQEIANDMQTVVAQTAQAQQALRQAEDVLSRRDVLAPEDGAITNIQSFTPRSTIPALQTVMELVPARDRLIVEVKLMPNDIELVAVGQRANVRLSAYRQRATPLIAAQVIYVSPDQQTDPQGNNFFVARMEMQQSDIDAVPEMKPSAGMPVEGFILGEKRTVASYVLAPLRDSMRRAMRD